MIFLIITGVISLVYCAICRIDELRQAKTVHDGPVQQESSCNQNSFEVFKQWVIDIF
jgi:hypothetical protein